MATARVNKYKANNTDLAFVYLSDVKDFELDFYTLWWQL